MKHNSACPVVEWYASHIQKQANKFIKIMDLEEL